MFYVYAKPGWTITFMTPNSFLTITIFIEVIGPRLEIEMRMEVPSLLWKRLWYRKKINSTLPNSSVACKITLNDTQVFLYAFYNPPISSSYRYAIEDFQLLLRNIPKNKPIVIRGDLNFPEVNWKTLYSPNETEDKVIEMFEEKLFRQIIDFPTCGNNILYTAFYQNCHLSAELDKSFPSIYNLTDHEAIPLSLENPVTETEPLIQKFRIFGNADYDAINEHLVEKPFQSICYTNINKMSEEFTRYLDGIFDLYVPKRTRHRQSLLPWISCVTSNLINKLKTQKRLWENKPPSYRKQLVLKLEIQVTDSAEEDRVVYQENLLGSRNTDRIFKHLKSPNKSACLPKVLMNDTKQSSLRREQVNMLNQFFHSVFSPKTNFSLKDFKEQKPSLTNFDISKNTIRIIMDDINATKSRGPNGIPPVFYVKTSKNLCNIMHSVLRNIKRLRKTPNSWKVAEITPIFKKGDRRKVENYRPVSLMNIDSKILEKGIHIALYNHF